MGKGSFKDGDKSPLKPSTEGNIFGKKDDDKSPFPTTAAAESKQTTAASSSLFSKENKPPQSNAGTATDASIHEMELPEELAKLDIKERDALLFGSNNTATKSNFSDQFKVFGKTALSETINNGVSNEHKNGDDGNKTTTTTMEKKRELILRRICAAILSKEASKVRSLMECVPYKSLFPDSTPPHTFVYQGRSILYFAAGVGDESIVKYICERHPALLHHPTVYGACPLTWAAYNGQLDSVKVLLEKGCDVNQKGEYEETALIAACCQGHLAVVQCLLAQSNVDICKRDLDGKTALFRAAIGNHSEIVDILKRRKS